MPINIVPTTHHIKPNPLPTWLDEDEQIKIYDYFNSYFGVDYKPSFWIDYMKDNCNCYHEDCREIKVNEYEYAMDYKKLIGGAKPDRCLIADMNQWAETRKGISSMYSPIKGSYFSPLKLFYDLPTDVCSDFFTDAIDIIIDPANTYPEMIINQKYGTTFSIADVLTYINSVFQNTQFYHIDNQPFHDYNHFLNTIMCMNPDIREQLWNMCFSKYVISSGNQTIDESNFEAWVGSNIGLYDQTLCGGSGATGTISYNIFDDRNSMVSVSLTTSDYAAWIQNYYTKMCGSITQNSCDMKLRFSLPEPPCRVVEISDPCIESMATLTRTAIINEYERQKMDAGVRFRAKYIANCIRQADFNIKFNGANNERHYTLYYYDQRGNLVKTVPPAGVRPFTSASDLAAVVSARDNNGSPVKPPHKMPSEYFFNAKDIVYKQSTPDGGTTYFWYDHSNRLIASQSAKQLPLNRYSYTKYDLRDRILESGEAKVTNNLLTNAKNTGVHHLDYDVYETQWLSTATEYKFRSRTYYDKTKYAAVATATGAVQENLIQRIASITLDENDIDNSEATYSTALHYSYDVLGNVKTLISENTATSLLTSMRYKKVDYDYDLQSGKVNKVVYQKAQPDQYIYKYSYDDNFKLSKLQTSYDGVIWETDATYYYYKHGPLARVELGKEKVQGIDYANTLQGWLKGLNSSVLYPGYDMGQDGAGLATTFPNGRTARDAVAMTLRYYKNGANQDYAQIGRPTQQVEASLPTAMTGNNLFNGNISSALVSIAGLTDATMGNNYKYDQLNRLKSMEAYSTPMPLSSTTASFNFATATAKPDYAEQISYDANGNIKTYQRNKDGGTLMDDLNYKYYYYPAGATVPSTYTPSSPPTGAGDRLTNQLAQVNDAVGTTVYNLDIDNQTQADNYVYDAVGNLIEDKQEQLTIYWTPTGKVQSIQNDKTSKLISFYYDPMGQRIAKKVETIGGTAIPEMTYYTRDAQGNTLAVYKNEAVTTEGASSNPLLWKEQYIYGSSRHGSAMPEVNMTSPPVYSPVYVYLTGMKQYELVNHLGNVLATIKDEKLQMRLSNTSITMDYYDPIVMNATDYYPFGMPMPSRTYSLSSGSKYRFGYQGSEKEDELYGEGNAYTTHFRILDPRLGKWFSIDPKDAEMPWQSPYNSMDGNPILKNDPNGDCPTCILGAVVGAAVDYGTQVAANAYKNGGLTKEAFTENINLVSIVAAGGEGFLTSGASVGKTILVKTTVAVINNTIELKTSKEGLKPKVTTNVRDIVKNTAVDLTVDGVIKTVAPTKIIKKIMNKNGIDNQSVSSTIKNKLKSLGVEINTKYNNIIKESVKKQENPISTFFQSIVKAYTNDKKETAKEKTNGL